MKTKCLYHIVLLLFALNCQGQNNRDSAECDTDAMHGMLMQTDSAYRLQITTLEEKIQTILKNTENQSDSITYPASPLPQVTGLKLRKGNKNGEIKAQWNTLPVTNSYTWQVFLNQKGIVVLKKGITTKNKIIISGLTSGQKVYVRVRGGNTISSIGPWSNSKRRRIP